MTEIHKERTRFEAWVRATNSVLHEDDKLNVILHIDSPDVKHDIEDEAVEELNHHYEQAGMEPIHTIAETIFPGWLYKRGGIEAVFEEYPEQLQQIMEGSEGYNWGTYFGRMIEREDPETGETFNPLKNLIEKMEQANQPDKPTYHSCYELDVHGGAADIPIYDPCTDRKQRIGIPCLSNVSFKLYDGEVHLTAFYRSHEYRFKVPGNLLGLARLQGCVAKEVGAEVGQLVIHSGRAFIQNDPPKKEFTDLVTKFEKKLTNEPIEKF
jgi:thymidylate synthase